jgi:ribosomal protein S18
MTFQSENIREYLHESAGFPLWTPYFYSGQPFMAIPEHYIFDLNFLYIFLFKNIFFAMNLAVISYFFLAGLGMYLLVCEITKKQNAAFIASLIFMFNSLMQKFILHGHLNILESYALIPFVFLFTYRALHKKSWLNNSIIAALFFSMMIYAGGIIFFLYTGLIMGVYMAWNLVGSNFKKILLKTILVSAVIGILLLGLSALKLLPVLEFTKMSSRSAGVNYQEYLGYPINLSNSWNILINIFSDIPFSGAIGIASFILLLFGLLSFRKKIIIFSILLVILSVLLAAGTSIAEFFYKLPGFGQMRHIERALVLFVFVSPIIAAYGFSNLVATIRKYKKNIKEGLIFSIVSLVLIIELMVLQPFPASIEVVRPNEIPIVDEISKDPGNFRIATYALSTPIGASGYNYYSQLGIPAIKGGGGIWINDYVQYLAIAQQVSPSKMFGILNGKYIISNKEINDSGLLLKKSEECEECVKSISEVYGPYLYENKNVIPRAFIVDNSVLLIGNDDDKNSLSYNLIIEDLDPLSTVLIQDKNSVNDYNIGELTKFNSLVLLGTSVTQKDIPKLQRYVSGGGKILPNLLEGKNSITQQEIVDALNSKSISKELELKQISANEFSIELDGEKGWLVLSERFAHFPGWKAKINNKELKMYKADIVISAVYLNGEKGELIFKYSPDSFRKGKIITMITALILIIYLLYIGYSKVKS